MIVSKVALVTGASSGIGQATAQLLARRGYAVFGTSRKQEQAAYGDFTMLPLDVDSDDSVQHFVETVLAKTHRIDLLVNNAGYSQSGAIEENSIPDAQAQFNTNVFGTMRVTNAVLPIMRQQGGGHIINVSSILGLTALPYAGLYSATKFALEGLSEALRSEVAQFNIQVSLVEPGTIKTDIGSHGRPPAHGISVYNDARQEVLKYLRDSIQNSADPIVVAEAILNIAQTANPPLHNIIGSRARLLATMKRVLPQWAFERLRSSVFHIPVISAKPIQLSAEAR